MAGRVTFPVGGRSCEGGFAAFEAEVRSIRRDLKAAQWLDEPAGCVDGQRISWDPRTPLRRHSRSNQSSTSVLELIGQRLIEEKLWHGFSFGRIEPRCLIEKEVTLRWPPGGGEGWG